MEIQRIGDNLYYIVLIGTAGGLLLASSLILFFVRYQRRLIRQQADMQKAELEHKQLLLNSIVQSQEGERMRISKDLHDHVGSSLSRMRLDVSGILNTDADMAGIKKIASATKADIDRIIEDIRNISHSLSPAGLELWGFHEALGEYCDKVGKSSGIEIHIYDSSDGLLRHLPFDDALSLFRVVQELINNTIKHANAHTITINTLKEADMVVLKYADDGKGMDRSSNKSDGIGIYNIESRLSMIEARYEIRSSPGKGYSFEARIPEKRVSKINKDGKN